MADLEAEYRTILLSEYEARRKINSRFSKNAFAKFLGVDSTYLSKLLSGKIILSLDIAEKITKKLKLSPEVRKKLLFSVAEEQSCHGLYHVSPDLTDCDSDRETINLLPRSRKKR